MEMAMPEIMTVRGSIDSADLGFTSMHEHILYDGRIFRQRFEAFIPPDAPVKPDEAVRLDNLGQLKHGFIMSLDAIVMRDEDVMAAELADFRSEGGSAVVDMSTPGLRVDPLATRRVSETSGVHIVGTTGLYSRDSWPQRFHDMGLEEMEAYMMQEVEGGIEGTDVKPGHVKVAIEEDFCEPEVKALRAGARVAGRTGLSMTVHQGRALAPAAGIRIADLLSEEGVDPARVVIAHNEGRFVVHNLQQLILKPEETWRLNLDVAKSLLDRGFNLSIDCFGHYWDAEVLGDCAISDWQRMAGLVALIRAGYTQQLVLGTDTFVKILLRRFGGEGYCRLTSFVVPTLKSVDVSADEIQQITVRNPARILAC
jgi:phosphotriesterase-related protein